MRAAIWIAFVISLTGGRVAYGQSLDGATLKDFSHEIAYPFDEELACAPKNRNMVTMSTPGDPSIRYGGTFAFDFSNQGQVKEVKLLKSSGKADVDFDCLCAILGSAPFSSNARGDRKVVYTFGGNDLGPDDGIRSINRKERRKFQQETKLPSNEYFVCNLIPVSFSFRYANVMTDQELCQSSNLRLIPRTFFAKDNQPTFEMIATNARFRKFYERWNQFASSNERPTKASIEKFRDEVDREFADMFIHPPSSISKS